MEYVINTFSETQIDIKPKSPIFNPILLLSLQNGREREINTNIIISKLCPQTQVKKH